jgi:hypothetical protein
VLSCRSIKNGVYYEMQTLAQKARNQLQARWPFEERIEIPFPARLFRTGELIIEVPYLLGKLVFSSWDNDDELMNKLPQKFSKQGGFALGAQSVLLQITQVETTLSLEAAGHDLRGSVFEPLLNIAAFSYLYIAVLSKGLCEPKPRRPVPRGSLRDDGD